MVVELGGRTVNKERAGAEKEDGQTLTNPLVLQLGRGGPPSLNLQRKKMRLGEEGGLTLGDLQKWTKQISKKVIVNQLKKRRSRQE